MASKGLHAQRSARTAGHDHIPTPRGTAVHSPSKKIVYLLPFLVYLLLPTTITTVTTTTTTTTTTTSRVWGGASDFFG